MHRLGHPAGRARSCCTTSGPALHKHPPYLDLWEWLWWTGLITFGLIIVEALFVFDYILVLATQVIGLGTLV